MNDEGASAPGNVDIGEIELIVGWSHVNIARLNRKKYLRKQILEQFERWKNFKKKS